MHLAQTGTKNLIAKNATDPDGKNSAESRGFLTVTNDSTAFIFYAMNIVLLLVGFDLWLTYSTMRVLILYAIFNIILFRASTGGRRYDGPPRRTVSAKVSQLLTMVLVLLLTGTIAGTYQSLHARSSYLVAVMGVTIVLFVVVLLISCGQPAFKESYALLAAISIVLVAGFGSYLAQPNLTNSPPYTSVDAYRDYTNAIRILSLARVDPDMMILAQYYRAFPVVPLEIANITSVAGLPVNISLLLLAVIADGLAVTSLFLLSKRVAGNLARSCSGLLLLPVMLVFLQPLLMDPIWLVEPIRMSIPIVTMILYLAYTRVFGSAPTRSVSIVLILLIMMVVPLHAASAAFVILFLGIMIFAVGSGRPARASLAMLGVLAMMFFFLYVLFSAGGSYVSVLEAGRAVWSMIEDNLRLRTGFIYDAYLARSQLGETGSFLLSTVPALLLSIFTTFVLKLVKSGRSVVADARQRSFDVMLGILLIVGFGVGLLSPLWKVDTRYFTFPLTPAAVVAVTMVIVWVLGDMSPRRKFLVVGLLSLCVLSMVTSPSYLESNPAYTRMMPIESERVAAMFVSTTFNTASGVAQVVTDWPFYPEVQALLYSRNIGIENKVDVPNLMFYPMAQCQETMILSRRYFLESGYLQTISPHVKSLSDNSTWSNFNRIYDDYSVSIYIGKLSC